MPSGVCGYPRASAIGRGIAITSGVSMNDLPGVVTYAALPPSARRWSSTAPQVLADGDQMTGRGPFTLGFGQSAASNDAAAPDDCFCTLTRTQLPPALASLESSKRFARSVSSSSFSGDVAIGTVTQPPAAKALVALAPTTAVPASRAVAIRIVIGRRRDQCSRLIRSPRARSRGAPGATRRRGGCRARAGGARSARRERCLRRRPATPRGRVRCARRHP